MRKGRHQLLQEWLGFVIDLLDVLLSWPVAVTFLVVLFRKQIEQMIPILGERLKSVTMGGNTIEFESAQQGFSPELQNINRDRIPQIVRSQGETDLAEDEVDQALASHDAFVDETPITEDTDEDDRTASDEEEELDALRRRLGEMNKG